MTKLTPFYQHMADAARPEHCGLCGDDCIITQPFCFDCHLQIHEEIELEARYEASVDAFNDRVFDEKQDDDHDMNTGHRLAIDPFTGKTINWDDTPFNSPDVDLNMQDLHDWYADNAKRDADIEESRRFMADMRAKGITEDDLPF